MIKASPLGRFFFQGPPAQTPDPKTRKMEHPYTNALIHQSSPYLLQHAHNPVNWEPWEQQVLDRAKTEERPLLISIGYASCHWCHVMERECFEDPQVAQLMNDRFVNIKVDREERPDVDQIYMDALQMITGQGGWPLNIVALPDGRPIWGATYLPKERWMAALDQLAGLFDRERERLDQYASDLTEGLHAINLIEDPKGEGLPSLSDLDVALQAWSRHFDLEMGGHRGAPKFPMPNNWDFLLHYSLARKSPELLEFVENTLEKMAYGGIHDHIGGGFSRYSVDDRWHVPHFEKMLYDNGQLIGLYAKAYAHTKKELYKKVVEQTISFSVEQLMDPNGGFYSSLDADSPDPEGTLKEGAHYVWTLEELTELLGEDFRVFQAYFNINETGHWEEGTYVPIRDRDEARVAEQLDLPLMELRATLRRGLDLLKKERDKRPPPRLDDKILCSWNALMLKGLVDAHRYLEHPEYLQLALRNAEFLEGRMIKSDHSLYRSHKDGTSTINGFLEDYACLIEAFLALYEASFDEKWLLLGKTLLDHTTLHFHDPKSGLFFQTSDRDPALIRRTVETGDNVISSSNSILANVLFKYGKIFPGENYGEMALGMLKRMQSEILRRPQGHSNWLHLLLYSNLDFHEIVLVGEAHRELAGEISREYLPGSILLGADGDSTLELVQNRHVKGSTLAYVCREGACGLPVKSSGEVLAQVRAGH